MTCSPSSWPSRLLYRRGRKSRRDLWITLYVLHIEACEVGHKDILFWTVPFGFNSLSNVGLIYLTVQKTFKFVLLSSNGVFGVWYAGRPNNGLFKKDELQYTKLYLFIYLFIYFLFFDALWEVMIDTWQSQHCKIALSVELIIFVLTTSGLIFCVCITLILLLVNTVYCQNVSFP